MKRLIAFITGHEHYFGVPLKNKQGVWVLPCFDCGYEKPTVNLEVK